MTFLKTTKPILSTRQLVLPLTKMLVDLIMCTHGNIESFKAGGRFHILQTKCYGFVQVLGNCHIKFTNCNHENWELSGPYSKRFINDVNPLPSASRS